MTDHTVAAYYAEPGTLVCERCGKVWRIAQGDDLEEVRDLFDEHDSHKCAPGVTRDAVEEVRLGARDLAADVPVSPWWAAPAVGLTADQWASVEAQGDALHSLGAALAFRFDYDEALLRTARPLVAGDPEMWEEVLARACIVAWKHHGGLQRREGGR